MEWDSFVERYDGSPFHMWGWGAAVASYGHDRYYLIARRADDPIGVLPLAHMKSRLFGEKLISVPFTSQGSAVVDDAHREAAISSLLIRTVELSEDLGVDFTILRSQALGERQAFRRRKDYVSFDVPLTEGPDSVWGAIRESRRRQIQQAMDDEEVTYEVGDSLADFRDYYDLYVRGMKGHGSPPHSFEFFRILWEQFHDSGYLRLGLVKWNDTVINGVIDFILGSTVIQKGVVSDYEYRDRQGGSLIHWKSLKWAAEDGRESYHLGRTREGSGVYMFKKSFGGTKVWLDDYYYFPNGEVEVPDAEDEKYELPKKVWRKLPLPVLKLIGPPIRKNISL
ncbi:GNAT family N-acetyltransferase [Haloarchaeobius sp. DFWS5]|uniref:GNAT family N-acetyltransferase n=1 Tax=Haloarchaeobius sp. DFWS5 TaxID=3446114 RepID=UPI003EB7A212